MTNEIIVVSGLPRSGTSLMMQILHAGGIEVVTDHQRTADTDNPRGYYEFEKVKQIKKDKSWLPDCRGKAVKMVSQLLADLPDTESYRIIFMERDFQEMLASQEKLLKRLGRPAVSREELIPAFNLHLERIHKWLQGQPHMHVQRISYKALVEQPEVEIAQLNEFLAGRLDSAQAKSAVDPSLYRNR